jgi:hypothetical protein
MYRLGYRYLRTDFYLQYFNLQKFKAKKIENIFA